MADEQLSSILNSGQIGSMYLGNTNASDRVLKKSEVDNTVKVTDDKVAQNTADISTNADAIQANTDNMNGFATGENKFIKGAFVPMDDISGLLEGEMAYDNVAKTLVIKSDIAEQTLNVGQETLLRVKNPSGSTYTNGQVVRQVGVDGGVPTIALALADTFSNARALGTLTHDILPGEEGYSTTFGYIGDIPTNQNGETWSAGDDLFISPTIPGGMTNILPDIASITGRLMTNTGVTGDFLSAPRNLLTLPPVGGWMKVIPATIAPGAGYINFTGFTDTSTSAGITADGTTGVYTIDTPGTYSVSLSVSFSDINAVNDGSIISIELWNATTNSSLFEYNIIVGRDDTVASGTTITQDDFSTGDLLVARYKETSGNVGAAVSVDNISFLVTSILIR